MNYIDVVGRDICEIAEEDYNISLQYRDFICVKAYGSRRYDSVSIYYYIWYILNSQNMFISHNTIKTKCHFDLVTLLESRGGKV